MTYFTTKVSRLDNLAAELNRLETASHTIVEVVVIDGFAVIISTTA
jgi:hypothetical protein